MFLLEINIFKVAFFYLLQIKVKTFFSEVYFSKVSILPSFEISIAGLETVGGFSHQLPYFYPLVDKHIYPTHRCVT